MAKATRDRDYHGNTEIVFTKLKDKPILTGREHGLLVKRIKRFKELRVNLVGVVIDDTDPGIYKCYYHNRHSVSVLCWI